MPVTHVVALAIGLAACATDLKSRRIPNGLTFGGALAALGYHLAVGGGSGLMGALTGWLAGIAFFFLPFALGGMGGGERAGDVRPALLAHALPLLVDRRRPGAVIAGRFSRSMPLGLAPAHPARPEPARPVAAPAP